MTDLFGEVISSYSRAQAIEDGVLVDVTTTAKEAGIKVPVALTRAVWEKYVEVPNGVQCQDVQGRLWDVLVMFRHGASGERSDYLYFSMYVRQHNRERLTRRDMVQLKAIIGPGDTSEPVITIMLPEED